MKKQLVATLLASVTLAATAPVFAAANPFVDVPAKHWAYDAVTQLAAAGVIDGYGDGAYRGDKTITRYEMAQIVAKALAKSDKMCPDDKAITDKLAKEFGEELTNLGVRVAALEANQMAVKWGGDLTIINYDLNKADDNVTTFEFRLTADAKVNDKISVKARVTTDEFDITGKEGLGYAEDLAMDNLYVATNLGGFDVNAGRSDVTLGQGLIYDDTLNGVAIAKGKFIAAVGSQYNVDDGYDLTALGLTDMKVGAANLGLNYAKVSPEGGAKNVNIWGADLGFDLGKLGVTAQYAKSDADGDPDAYRVDTKLGSSPFTLGYQKIEAGSITAESALDWIYGDQSSALLADEGTKGWDISYSKDVAENVTFTLKYADLKGVESGLKEQEIRTTLEFIF